MIVLKNYLKNTTLFYKNTFEKNNTENIARELKLISNRYTQGSK